MPARKIIMPKNEIDALPDEARRRAVRQDKMDEYLTTPGVKDDKSFAGGTISEEEVDDTLFKPAKSKGLTPLSRPSR